jgi:pimeloyl-ACP methyl ester carboxylesterase
VVRVWIAAAAAALALAAPAHAATRQDVTIASTDGTPLAATLHLPSAAPPAGGWPAIVVMHGISQNRTTADSIATAAGFVGEEYAVLTFDARGHGASGGLITIDGPNEIADVRAVSEWLRRRSDISDTRIGAWGISYGGGAALLSLAAGVQWAAVEVAETWSDLGAALLPQGLAKSGVAGLFFAGLPPARIDPSLVRIRDSAFAAANLAEVSRWTAQRSSLGALRGNRTPIFLMQGRRDFAFGLDQARRLYSLLRGPKRLWIGNHGHPPSRFPAADTPKMLAEGKAWFDRFLRGVPNGIERTRPVTLAAEGTATTRTFAALPRTRTLRPVLAFRRTTIVPTGKWTATKNLGGFEVAGSPLVTVTATATAGWSRLVAVLSARTPAGQEIVVSGGGVATRAGTRTYTIRLIDQATVVPRGSRLVLTLGSSSLRQNPGNLLYLDLPMPPTARLAIRRVGLTLPVLR